MFPTKGETDQIFVKSNLFAYEYQYRSKEKKERTDKIAL